MKLVVRTIFLLVLTALMTYLIVYLNNVNFLTNEIHNATYLASQETMVKEMDYLIDNSDSDVKTLEYKMDEYFIDRFNGLVKDPSVYELDVVSDEKHGIFNVNVSSNYSSLVKDVNLTSIVEDEISLDESGGIDEFDVYEYKDAARSDHVLYERKFDDAVTLNSFYIDIEAYSKSNGDKPMNRYEPKMKLTLVDVDGNTTVINKKGVSGWDTLDEVNFDSDNYDFEPMEVTYVKLEMSGVKTSDSTKADKLRIGSTGKNYFEYEGLNSIKHDLSMRFINKNYVPDDSSIWKYDEYQDVIKEYLNL